MPRNSIVAAAASVGALLSQLIGTERAIRAGATDAARPTGTTPIIDWYSPRLLIPVLTILGLCVLDGLLTVMLMKHGAAELNPVMALFLPHNLLWFAFVKLALTGVGLCVLVACSRMRLFRRIPGEAVRVRRARRSICG